MVCRKCGAEIEAGFHFCGECGARARGEDIFLRWLIGHRDSFITIAGLVLILVFLKQKYDSRFGSAQSGSAPMIGAAPDSRAVSSTSPEAEDSGAPTTAMNETLDLGLWSYEVTSMQWADSVKSEHETEAPDAKFLLVHMVIRNNDAAADSLPPLKVISSNGTIYDPSAKGNFVQDSFGAGLTVNPGATVFGIAVFDVPKDTYKLIVSERLGPTRTATMALQ